MSLEFHVIRNDLPDASTKAKAAIRRGLDRSRTTVDSNVSRDTPVLTGYLQSRGRSEVLDVAGGPVLVASNDADYAIHRHKGTSRMEGVPFITSGLERSTSTIESNIADELQREFS